MTFWPIRWCPNGRLEVQCGACLNLFWPTATELARWRCCFRCVELDELLLSVESVEAQASH